MTLLRCAVLAAVLYAGLYPEQVRADLSDLPPETAAALERRDYAAAREDLAALADAPDAAEAKYQYAILLINGLGGAVDRDAGYALLDAAASQSHAPAAELLARVYLTGAAAGVTRDPVRASELLQIAVDQSVPSAQFYLASLKLKGVGVPKDAAAGLALMEASANGGNVEAQYELSKLYSRGTEIEQDQAQALRWLTAAAESGKAEAQFFLANAIETGAGTTQDKAEALRWFRRAAEQGLPIAQRRLGTAYLTGGADTPRNPAEALRWLTAAAEAGDPGAMFNLATAYGGMEGIERNDARALVWLKAASDSGLARATYMMAQFHEAGRGTQIDIRTAASLYRTAYEQGDERGALRLGHLTGKGALDGIVPPHFSVPWTVLAAKAGDEGSLAWLGAQADDGLRPAQASYGALLLEQDGRAADAAIYLEKAAEAGAPGAQHQLGLLYTTGNGVDLDYVAGHKWLNIAATNGVEDAAKTRNVISELMTPEQIAKAQGAARTFFENATAPSGSAASEGRE